jgi:hypothetical protein
MSAGYDPGTTGITDTLWAMNTALHWANAGLAFLLEVAALIALGSWGVHAGPGTPAKVALGIGAPLLAAVLWGLFAAPRARFKVPLPAVLAVKALFFAAAATALWATGHPVLAAAFAIVVVANTTIVTIDRSGQTVSGTRR